jgi:hypothetical protein
VKVECENPEIFAMIHGMLRTRDYALGLSIMVFLLVGIGVTLLKQGYDLRGGLAAAVFVAQPSEAPASASVSEEVEISREERIASLRTKIAALGVFAQEAEPIPEVIASTSEPADITVAEVKEVRCGLYKPYSGVWNSRGLIVSEVEGARLVYRETAVMAASGTSALPTVLKDVLLQLPVKSVPTTGTNCIASDVIGITKHGSLIRNHEIAAYKSYDAAAHIGYALDGFPIYGSSDENTDLCGGVVVAGQYRYYIHPQRETILSCFAGTPASL